MHTFLSSLVCKLYIILSIASGKGREKVGLEFRLYMSVCGCEFVHLYMIKAILHLLGRVQLLLNERTTLQYVTEHLQDVHLSFTSCSSSFQHNINMSSSHGENTQKNCHRSVQYENQTKCYSKPDQYRRPYRMTRHTRSHTRAHASMGHAHHTRTHTDTHLPLTSGNKAVRLCQ